MKFRIPAVAFALISLFAVCVPSRLDAQSPPSGDADDPKFAPFVYDVVSFKPFKPDTKAGGGSMGVIENPDGYTMKNAPVSTLIGQAFRTAHMQMAGAPDWARNERFDMEAKMSSEVMEALSKLSPTDQKLARKHMLQQLLREYLKVSIHMESKEVPVYELQVGKNGPKLTEVTDASVPNQGMLVMGGPNHTYVYTGRATSLDNFLPQLSYTVGKPVFDKTGLAGRYQFELKFSPEGTSMAPASTGAGDGVASLPSDAPDIMTAIQEQLGLKLVPAKGMMDFLVIDHVERPTMN